MAASLSLMCNSLKRFTTDTVPDSVPTKSLRSRVIAGGSGRTLQEPSDGQSVYAYDHGCDREPSRGDFDLLVCHSFRVSSMHFVVVESLLLLCRSRSTDSISADGKG